MSNSLLKCAAFTTLCILAALGLIDLLYDIRLMSGH